LLETKDYNLGEDQRDQLLCEIKKEVPSKNLSVLHGSSGMRSHVILSISSFRVLPDQLFIASKTINSLVAIVALLDHIGGAYNLGYVS